VLNTKVPSSRTSSSFSFSSSWLDWYRAPAARLSRRAVSKVAKECLEKAQIKENNAYKVAQLNAKLIMALQVLSFVMSVCVFFAPKTLLSPDPANILLHL
jgi:hypothetical protein